MSAIYVGHCEICGAVVEMRGDSTVTGEDYAAKHAAWHERLRAALAGIVGSERTDSL